ncbi:MAG TPA: hypothetical protein VGS20_14800 [Candidatus Acidoferrales bacterium]|nr:hypothetical protein [Candidatus Acidoferrales bacterium]
MKKRKQANPHCPVPGCNTKAPHRADPAVQALLSQSPATVIDWTKRCIVELIQSVIADIHAPGAGRMFAYLTRWRDPEELYHRVLYALLIAPASHLPHIFSGDLPNGFSAMWRKVNEVIYEGRGELLKERTDPGGRTFTAMDLLNQHAHNSYFTMLMTFGIVRKGGNEWKAYVQKHVESWQRRVEYLNHIEGLFRIGRDKTVVLDAITNMHRPLEAWKDVKQPATAVVKLVRSVLLKKGARHRYLVIDQPAGMTGFRFRLHVGDTPNWDEKNLILVRTGAQEDLLKAFEADLEAVKEEGWIEEGSWPSAPHRD